MKRPIRVVTATSVITFNRRVVTVSYKMACALKGPGSPAIKKEIN